MNRPLIALTVWLIVLIGLLLPVESALGQSVWSRSGALSWQPDFCPICPSLSHPNEECPWAILGHHGPLEAAAVTRVETGRMGGVDSSAGNQSASGQVQSSGLSDNRVHVYLSGYDPTHDSEVYSRREDSSSQGAGRRDLRVLYLTGYDAVYDAEIRRTAIGLSDGPFVADTVLQKAGVLNSANGQIAGHGSSRRGEIAARPVGQVSITEADRWADDDLPIYQYEPNYFDGEYRYEYQFQDGRDDAVGLTAVDEDLELANRHGDDAVASNFDQSAYGPGYDVRDAYQPGNHQDAAVRIANIARQGSACGVNDRDRHGSSIDRAKPRNYVAADLWWDDAWPGRVAYSDAGNNPERVAASAKPHDFDANVLRELADSLERIGHAMQGLSRHFARLAKKAE